MAPNHLPTSTNTKIASNTNTNMFKYNYKYSAEKFLNFQESKLAPLLSTAGASIEYFEKCQQEEMSRELPLFKI